MINIHRPRLRALVAAAAAMAALSWGTTAQAHCDGLDGPVVNQARRALESGNVNLVLGWVQKKDEAEIRSVFAKSVAVRKSGATARELADHAFFETLVRVHRAGEGAPYTGLNPAGRIGHAVAVADESIESGRLEPVSRMIDDAVERGLHRQFEAVAKTKRHDPNDVDAARAYVAAYVEYVHYVERVEQAARSGAGHAGGAPAAPAQSAAHQH